MSNKLTRKQFLKIAGLSMTAGVVAACGPAAQQVPTSAPAPASPTDAPAPTAAATAAQAQAAATVAPAASASTAGLSADELLIAAGLPLPGAPNDPKGWKVIFPALPDGMPLNPPVTITSSRRVDSTVAFPEGDSVDNNLFTRYMKALMGIEWKTPWTWVGQEDGLQKYSMAMAANDLPDMSEGIPSTVLVKMYEADMLEDITDAFDNLASQKWVKDVWAPYGNLPWAYASYKGRKMGWPYVERASQNDKVMWIRQDWLDKVGLKAPTTIDELTEVMTAFKKAELGQGAKGTTLGMAAQQELGFAWYGSFDPIWGSMTGSIPEYWTLVDGKLANGTINPKNKAALEMLAKWYKDGLIPADFATRPTAEAQKLVAGNQAGLHFTPYWDGGWGAAESKKNDPAAVWRPMDIPAGPEGKKKHWSNPFGSAVFGFKKGFQHVDKVIKQNNFMAEWVEDPAKRAGGDPQIIGVTAEIKDGKVVPIGDLSFAKWAFGPVLGTGGGGVDPQRSAKELQWNLDNWSKIEPDKRDAQQATFFDDPTGASQLNQEALLHVTKVSEEQAIKNLFNSLPTPTMVASQADLKTLTDETFVGIITGQKPVDAFDEYVTTWKSLGGEKITDEVNEWWATQQ